MSITNKEDIQNFQFPYQESSKHQEIVITDHDIYGEVQVQGDLLKSLNINGEPF